MATKAVRVSDLPRNERLDVLHWAKHGVSGCPRCEAGMLRFTQVRANAKKEATTQ